MAQDVKDPDRITRLRNHVNSLCLQYATGTRYDEEVEDDEEIEVYGLERDI
jgi:hypothetical protein